MAYNNNPNNPTPEHVTAGVHNHGAYTLQQCKLRNIGNVPKIVGLQVVTLDTAEIYIWIDGNGLELGTVHGERGLGGIK